MLSYDVTLDRLDAHGSRAACKQAAVVVDTDVQGRVDAFNPAELLLAALGACMLKNIERVSPILKFSYRGVHIDLHGQRQDSPPRMRSIRYRILVDTDESNARLSLLHQNVQKYGTVYNTVAPGTELSGTVERADVAAA